MHPSVLDQQIEARIAFHRAIVSAAHNPILVDPFDSFTPRSRQAMVDLLRIDGEFGSDADRHAHLCILDAIADHEGHRAAAFAREHLRALAIG